MTDPEKQELIKTLKGSFRQFNFLIKNLKTQLEGDDKEMRDIAIYKSVGLLKALKDFVVKFNEENRNENH